MNSDAIMESISSGSELELEDGEIIDDSDSELSTFNIEDSKREEKKYSSSRLGPRITLFPLKNVSPKKKTSKHGNVEVSKSKENKKVRKNESYENLRIKISGINRPAKSKVEDRPRQKTRCRHRRTSFDKIYEDWGRSIDLLTSPKKRKKSVDSLHKYSSSESLNNERRNSKKTCLEQKPSSTLVNENPLLAKLVCTGDINLTNVVLKEKNGKNVEKQPLSTSNLHNSLLDVSSDESVTHDLILKDLNSSPQYLSKESLNSLSIIKPSSCAASSLENCCEPDIICIDVVSKTTSELSCPNSNASEGNQNNIEDIDSDTIFVPKNVLQSYLAPSSETSTNPRDEVYSPETFIPFDFNALQVTDSLELRDALKDRDDFVSENYDCIPMSCSEEEESSRDSKESDAKVSEPNPKNLQQSEATEENEEDEELRLRISALKTWLQRKYAKSKPNEGGSIKSCDASTAAKMPKKDHLVVSPSKNILYESSGDTERVSEHVEEIPSINTETSISKPEEIPKSDVRATSSQSVKEITVEFPVISPKSDPENNSFLDEEANENYELALRSLLVSNLLKKKLQNSKELLTESNAINKASSSLKPLKKSLVKNDPSKSSNNSNKSSNISSKSISISSKPSNNSKYRTVNPSKNSIQGSSISKTNSKSNSMYNCDKFQSKFVFNNSYEPPNQTEDSKYLKSIANFKVPVIEKFIIHLSEDSDYDSDESVAAGSVNKLSFEEKNTRSSSASACFPAPVVSNCSETSAAIPSMDAPNPMSQVEQSSQQTDHASDNCRKSDQILSADNFKENGRLISSLNLIEQSCLRLSEEVTSSIEEEKVEVTSSDNTEAPKFSDVTSEAQNVESIAKSVPAEKRAPESVRESSSSKGPQSSFSSPRDIVASKLISAVDIDGKSIQSSLNFPPIVQQSTIISKSSNAKEKSKKATSALVTDIIVPVEKKLLRSRLNLLQNLDSLQSCVSSCEGSALKCSKSFTKVIQLQKALKLATADYKTHFKSLKTCLQSYKTQSQKVSSFLNDYAQAQKDCAKIGKQIIGSNYKTPKEGMSAMATKFKLMKEKKLELLNNTSIANEIKKANFSSDALDSSAKNRALPNININQDNPTTLSKSSCPQTTVFGISVTVETESERIANDFHSSEDNIKSNCDSQEKVVSSGKLPSVFRTDPVNSKDSVIIKTVCDTGNFVGTSASSANTDGSYLAVDQKGNSGDPEILSVSGTEMNPSLNGKSKIVDRNAEEKPSVGDKNNVAIEMDTERNILDESSPKSLLVSSKGVSMEKMEGDETSKCQQRFKKYTPFFQSLLSRGKEDDGHNVDSIICPFGLQGTCRDETCEYKHLQN